MIDDRLADVAGRVAVREAADVERHPVGGNERARAVDQDRRIVRSLRLEADADLAPMVALHEPEGLDASGRSWWCPCTGQAPSDVSADRSSELSLPSASRWIT